MFRHYLTDVTTYQRIMLTLFIYITSERDLHDMS